MLLLSTSPMEGTSGSRALPDHLPTTPSVQVFGHHFIEQNPRKGGKWGNMASKGQAVTWITTQPKVGPISFVDRVAMTGAEGLWKMRGLTPLPFPFVRISQSVELDGGGSHAGPRIGGGQWRTRPGSLCPFGCTVSFVSGIGCIGRVPPVG